MKTIVLEECSELIVQALHAENYLFSAFEIQFSLAKKNRRRALPFRKREAAVEFFCKTISTRTRFF